MSDDASIHEKFMTFEEWRESRFFNGIYWGDLKAAWDASRKAALDAAAADLADALIADCENGVKFLNEAAVARFIKEYPELYKAMRLIKDEGAQESGK